MLRAADTICKTDTGRQRRDNEDNAYVRAPLFVVADGMGGAQAGEVASALAVEEFQRPLPEAGAPAQRLAERVQEANRRIYEISSTDHEHAGMGTTLTAAYLDDADLAVAHVGDSRAYIFRDGALTRLTQDHSLVEELVRRGKLTAEQAAEHPQRSIITRALGIENDVLVDTWTYPMRAADVVLMCSDGLTSMIGEGQIAEVLGAQDDLEQAGEQLIAAANEAGGRDNITVVLFRVEDVGGDPDDRQPTQVAEALRPPDRETEPIADTPAAAGSDQPAARSSASALLTVAPPGSRVEKSGRAGAGSPVSTPPVVRSGVTRRPALPARGPRRRGEGRWFKPVAALLSILIVLFLFGGGGYLASRELFFIGTNPDGIVTVYRGLPYDGPLGLSLYEQVYVSGIPFSDVPATRRAQLLNHDLRSQADAIGLVRAAESGQLTR
ncbi:MAG: Stp1/IreP family PP2C-type Ser/Thr phosphatase [Solirubrobacteraceae bacterium]